MSDTPPLNNDFDKAPIIAFDILAFSGIFLNAAVLAPVIFSSRVKRRAVWRCVIFSFLIDAMTYTMLLGQQFTSQPPRFGTCFLQATMAYACPMLCAIAYTCFTVDFYLQMTALTTMQAHRSKPGSSLFRLTEMLVILPWACSLIVIVEVFMLVKDPSMVERAERTYCHLTTPIAVKINIITILISGFFSFVLEIYMAAMFYRYWSTFRRFSRDPSGVSLSMYIRIVLFNILGAGALGLSALGYFIKSDQSNPKAWNIWIIGLVLLPNIAALAFGTQKDILQAWLFWRERKPDVSHGSTFSRSSSRQAVLSIA